MKPHVKQYLVAIFVSLCICAMQGYSAVQRFGFGGNNPKAELMQRQVVEHFKASASLSAEFVAFIVLVIFAHALLFVVSVAAYRSAAALLCVEKRDRLLPCIFFQFASLVLAIFTNRWLFPLSSAFEDADLLMVQTLSPLLILGLTIVVCGVLLLAMSRWVVNIFRNRNYSLAALFFAFAVLVFLCFGESRKVSGTSSARPDVIILGVDSLRPDFVSTYGKIGAGLTPAIDGMLGGAVVLDDASTPVARTFVSYQSLIMGMNPINHGVRFNLYPRSEFDSSGGIVWQLKRQGYTTMLAMDESRFANFDASSGFDVSVVPTVGALDFVVGSGFDFVATNLLVAILPPSRWMSPLQGNRAAYRSYRADDHPGRLIKALRNLPSQKPLFLVSHLCLPHWPYLPAGVNGDSSLDWVSDYAGFQDSSRQYLRAIKVVDAQFADIVSELDRLGRLDNAIVIVMSDHGEDFGMARDRLWMNHVGGHEFSSYGHGSFALSQVQNHVVMGIQRYRKGKPVWRSRRLAGPASIIDLAPTIADELALDGSNYEGRSWLAELRGGMDLPVERIRYFENGLRSVGVEQAQINEKAVANEMSYLYRITMDDRFEIRPELLPQKLAEKQRGAVLGRWGVMTDPRSDVAPAAGDCWQAVDYERRVVTCVGFPAAQPEVADLQAHVCRYYAPDPGFYARWCGPAATGSRRDEK